MRRRSCVGTGFKVAIAGAGAGAGVGGASLTELTAVTTPFGNGGGGSADACADGGPEFTEDGLSRSARFHCRNRNRAGGEFSRGDRGSSLLWMRIRTDELAHTGLLAISESLVTLAAAIDPAAPTVRFMSLSTTVGVRLASGAPRSRSARINVVM